MTSSNLWLFVVCFVSLTVIVNSDSEVNKTAAANEIAPDSTDATNQVIAWLGTLRMNDLDVQGNPGDSIARSIQAKWAKTVVSWVHAHDNEFLDVPKQDFNSVVWGTAIGTAITFVLAFIYKSVVTDKRSATVPTSYGMLADPIQEFDTQVHHCCDNLPILLWACLCPRIRMGDTYQAAGVASFWQPLFVTLAANVARVVCVWFWEVDTLWPLLVIAVCQVGYLAPYRHSLRVRLGAHHQAQLHQGLQDTALYCFCLPCAVSQEAREIDGATGVQVGCCLGVRLVGQPLMVQAAVI
mmetsp:Transcript_28047/g.64742  ORF Transcript_28047/g.64742 Transcript_28047/m.64742 type:complete len:296 (+) Transcript_28047:119-1006(+)